jgi:hypothetical protein
MDFFHNFGAPSAYPLNHQSKRPLPWAYSHLPQGLESEHNAMGQNNFGKILGSRKNVQSITVYPFEFHYYATYYTQHCRRPGIRMTISVCTVF